MAFDRPGNFAIVSELALTGDTRPVKGILSMALQAATEGRDGLLVPTANASEAAVVEGLNVYPVGSLAEAVSFLSGQVDMDFFSEYSYRLPAPQRPRAESPQGIAPLGLPQIHTYPLRHMAATSRARIPLASAVFTCETRCRFTVSLSTFYSLGDFAGRNPALR